MPGKVRCFRLTMCLVQTWLLSPDNLHLKQSPGSRPFIYFQGLLYAVISPRTVFNAPLTIISHCSSFAEGVKPVYPSFTATWAAVHKFNELGQAIDNVTRNDMFHLACCLVSRFLVYGKNFDEKVSEGFVAKDYILCDPLPPRSKGNQIVWSVVDKSPFGQ